MRLTWKFFFTYVLVVAVSLVVLAISTILVAPVEFSDHINSMPMMQTGMMGGMMGPGSSRGAQTISDIEDELDAHFRESVNNALLWAGIAATLAAGIVSWIVSRQIVRPIRYLSAASHTIAQGHYDQRLTYPARDELGELIESFNQMAAALAETESMRRQLIADVSHELKTPLASIKGYMEGLQDGVIAPTPETFALVYAEANRLQRLVFDLQELSRTEAAAFVLHRAPHAPTDLIAPVIARLRPQFADKGVALINVCSDDLPPVRVDRDRMQQVFTNLLGNALQYTPAGGSVTVSATMSDSTIVFAIADTGIGLAADDLERVFQRFYRVDKSRSRTSGGSGIGLTITRHIVEAHGGRVWAESGGMGQGSTFFVAI